MSVEYSRATLNQVSRDFRKVAGRLFESDIHEATKNVRRLLEFIDNNPLLAQYVERCLKDHPPPSDEEFAAHSSQRFDAPTHPDAEVAYVFALLSHIVRSGHALYDYAIGYSSKGLKDDVASFNRVLVQPFVNHIVSYVERLSEEAAETGVEGESPTVNAGHGTVVIIGDVSGSNMAAGASQAIHGSVAFSEADELRSRLEGLRDQLDEVPNEDRERVVASLERLIEYATHDVTAPSEVVRDAEVVARASRGMMDTLKNVAVGAAGSLAGSGLIRAIKLVLEYVN